MIVNSGAQVNDVPSTLLNVTVTGTGNTGGTVTATGTSATYTGTTDNNGQCSILIGLPDTYSVTYTKNGSTTSAQSVMVGFAGATYSVTIQTTKSFTLAVQNEGYGNGQMTYDGNTYHFTLGGYDLIDLGTVTFGSTAQITSYVETAYPNYAINMTIDGNTDTIALRSGAQSISFTYVKINGTKVATSSSQLPVSISNGDAVELGINIVD